MTESLLPKKQTSFLSCNKSVCGGLLFATLAGVMVVYSISGLGETVPQSQASHSGVSSISRVLDGEINVKDLSPMKKEWAHLNDLALEIEKLSPTVLEGKLVQASYETTFQVSYMQKNFRIARKNTETGIVEASLYSEKGEKEEAVYQFTDSKGTVTDGFDAFEKYTSSDLLSDTYVISLKLATYGLTGKSAPVIKGFHTISHTLVKQEQKNPFVEKKFTAEMQALVQELNDKILEENSKTEKNSLLWSSPVTSDGVSFLNEKLMIGPCDRYGNCTCEIENRSTTCGNPCFGLCGPNCDCWAFVCGDCDCHCFCYNHDNYCSCVSRYDYHCWSIWLWFDACC